MPQIRTYAHTGFDLDAVRLLGGEAVYNPGETFGPRVLRDFEFVCIVDGDATYHVDQATHAAPAGSIILGKPGTRESYVWDTRHVTHHLFFHFMPQSLAPDWPDLDAWPVVKTFDSDHPIFPLFRHIIRITDRNSPEAIRAIATLIDMFLADPAPPGRHAIQNLPDPVGAAIHWAQHILIRTPDHPIALDDLARVASLSPSSLCRLFNRSIGVSPLQVVRRLRLGVALTLVIRSNLTIKQIAARTGFASPYHFSRSFAAQYGKPPTAIRADVAAGQPPPEVSAW